MDRYAVINEKGVVVNVIAWDGKAEWKPPEGHKVLPHHDVGAGDLWHEEIQDFVRPLKNLKSPEDEISIKERQAKYQEAKEKLKSSMLFLKHDESIEAP